LDYPASLDVKRRLFLVLTKIGHDFIRLSNDRDGVVSPILLIKIRHEPLERPLMGLLRATLQLHGHELAISHLLEDRIASRHALVEVTRPECAYLPPCDRRIRALLAESLLVLGERGRRRYRLLLDVGHEGIERRLGVARKHRVQVDAVKVLEEYFVAQIKSADAINLCERPAIYLEALRMCPVARKDDPDGIEEPVLRANLGCRLCVIRFLSVLLGAMLAFCFVR
jgi:hypothetical protein